jgi:RND family efflux transporter MFP subunit
LLGSTGVGAYFIAKSYFASDRTDLLFHSVRKDPIQVTVVEKGTLEAAENRDVICQVKATRGSSFATTIRWVIDDGNHVKKGDKIIELDKSGLEDQKLTQQIAVEKAKAEVVAAEGKVRITESQNNSDLTSAEVAVELAEIDLEKYEKGEYLQLLNDVNGQIKLAESELEMWRQREAWSESMVRRDYLQPSQLESERSRLQSAKIKLESLNDQRRVLTEFTKKRQEKALRNALEEAKRNLDRVKIQNAAKLNTDKSDLTTKQKVLQQELEKLNDIEEQIRHCTILSPQDGMIVYFVSEQSRSMSGSAQSIIAQGEPVREGQKLIRIPSLQHMLVNTKVHEAMVSKLKSGMKVDVRVDAFPDVILKGRVRSVATIAIQNDWRSADVKMYQTMISIDDSKQGLRPGMSAECSIFVDATDDPVLTLPIQAIVGGAELGPKRKCFVKEPDGTIAEREIVIGLSNERVAEIRSGLSEGDMVVLNPRVLLGDKDRTRTRQPGDFDKAGGNKGGAAKTDDATGADSKSAAPPPDKAGGDRKGMPKFDPNDPRVKEFMRKMKEKGIDPTKMKMGGGGPPGGGPPGQ